MPDLDLSKSAFCLRALQSPDSFQGALKKWLFRLIVFLLGGVGALSLAPLYILPCLWISISGVLWLTQNRDSKAAFRQGWWFGFGYFTVGLYWIAFSLTVDLAKFGWMIPFAVFGLPALLAFFIAPVFALTSFLNKEDGITRLLLFALLWTLFEWLRGHLFTGFPWNLISYGWISFLPMAQAFSLVGAYGLSFFTILWASSPLLWPRHKFSLFCLCGFALGFYIFGFTRLETPIEAYEDSLVLRLVQPSIPQKFKSSRNHAEQNLQKIIDLTNSPAQGKTPDVYIWPESATSFFLANDAVGRHQVMQKLMPARLLLTGVTRGERHGHLKFWNSLAAIHPLGSVIASYDKSHLVPFGEYLPFRSLLGSFLQKVTPGAIDYSSGRGLQTLNIAGLPPFSPLICYEIIFPGAVKSSKAPSPQWLLNITNDAWYGHTSGPYQHLAIAQARAIEEGLPVIRVGNNGISASIDPYGRILKRLELDEVGVLDVSLPKPTLVPTLYGQYGDKILWSLLLLGLGVLILRKWSLRTPN